MVRIVCLMVLSVVAALSQSSCFVATFADRRPEPVAPTQGYQSLDKFPFKEAWYGMYFQEEKVGYSHFKIEPSGNDFVITNEAFMRLTAMQKTNEAEIKEKVVVRPDLSMISFESDQRQNDKKMHYTGQTKGDKFVVEAVVGSEKLNPPEIPIVGKLYHSSAASLMPALKGLKDAAVYKFTMFRPEEIRTVEAEQLIMSVKGNPGPQGAVWKVKNTFGKTETLSWLNKAGLPAIDKSKDGALVTVLEDEATARKFAEKKNN
jgi:hypothetical protein